MFKEFTQALRQFATISDADIEKISGVIKVRHVKRKKNILNEGDQVVHMYFLNSGLLRYYVYDKQGEEHTTDIVKEQNWFGDTEAFIMKEEARINVEAIEDCEIFALSRDDINRFYDEIPGFERLSRKVTEYYLIKALNRGRIIGRSGSTAAERYAEFYKSHPDLEGRVPAIYLASYLGLAPETISRLRNQNFKQP